jgi:hypothetical protein
LLKTSNGFLNTSIGIFLDLVTGLYEADRGSDDKLATAGLLVACGKGTLTQKIEFIFVEAALQSQQ